MLVHLLGARNGNRRKRRLGKEVAFVTSIMDRSVGQEDGLGGKKIEEVWVYPYSFIGWELKLFSLRLNPFHSSLCFGFVLFFPSGMVALTRNIN